MIRNFSLIAIIVYAVSFWGQAAPPPATGPDVKTSAADQLATGTSISAELSKALDAKKLKPNDKIEARTAVDLLSHGQIVIPRNAKIIGHVTEAKAHTKQSPDSMVGIEFDRVVMKDGRELALKVVVQAVGRPLQTSSPFAGDDSMSAGTSGIPSAAQAQRGTVPGSTSPNTASYPAGYPPHGASAPADQGGQLGSSVSPLGPTSQGVIGMKGLSLSAAGAASVLSSSTDNVHLDSGAQLILRVQ